MREVNGGHGDQAGVLGVEHVGMTMDAMRRQQGERGGCGRGDRAAGQCFM